MTSWLLRPNHDRTSSYYVYELYGSSDELLYVGITRQDPRDRLDEHRYNQPWAPEISEQRLVHRDLSRREAVRIEKELIRIKRPVYNLQHSRNRHAAQVAISRAEATYGPARADDGRPVSHRRRRLYPTRRSGSKGEAASLVILALSLFAIWQKLSPRQQKWLAAAVLVGLVTYTVLMEFG